MDAPEINADDLKLREFACPDGSCGSDIFCSNSLGATGLNPTASQTVASMCALRGPGYFSESAADLLMAARFCNQTANFSTEPNTPWMLADYALSLSVQQDKLDSGKRIDGFAQVDLLLCNNASCSIVADLQHILPSPDDTAVPVLAMGFSGVAYDVMIANEYGFRSAAGVGMASIGKEHLESPRPNLAPAAGAWTSRLDGNASVMEVQWRVPNANLLIENREDTKPSEGPALVDLQELAMQLDNVDTAMWRQLAVGHYNNAIFLS